jgi:hypothetical protein
MSDETAPLTTLDKLRADLNRVEKDLPTEDVNVPKDPVDKNYIIEQITSMINLLTNFPQKGGILAIGKLQGAIEKLQQ